MGLGLMVYEMWKTMVVVETEPLRHPIGFVHFNERDQRFEYIDKVLRDAERRDICYMNQLRLIPTPMV